MGHEQTRNRGTVGGSLVHADPSAELALAAMVLDVRSQPTWVPVRPSSSRRKSTKLVRGSTCRCCITPFT
ncbi:MAG: FAD binding domain-containing protein [Limnohabitans sp.]